MTRDGKEYLIPNEDLITGQVVTGRILPILCVSISSLALRMTMTPSRCAIAIEAAQTVKRVLGDPRAPVCHEMGFGDSSVDYTLRFWIMDPAGGLTNVRGTVYLALWDTFKANGVSIPFPRERCGCWRVRRNRA